jgi:glycine hydroxymethyltransferase
MTAAESYLAETLASHDPEILDCIQNEARRQNDGLELIASENFTSRAVLEAAGSILTNKYAEGLPGKRYYGGCEFVDVAENLAIERAKQLFAADHVNVQPHSGSQANMAVYFSQLKPGDKIMGMRLDHGGHLTHGSPVNFSGFMYDVAAYGVAPDNELLDYDAMLRDAKEARPKLIVGGASAYSRTIDFAKMRQVADEVGALFMVDMAHISGLVAAGEHPSPVPYADFVSSTTHKTLRGPRSGFVMCREQFGAALDKMVLPGIQGGPLMHIIAAKAVCFKQAMTQEFKDYARQICLNAKALCQALSDLGWRIVSGGTDTHLFIVDVMKRGITGKQAERTLDKCGITVSASTIPNDTQKPYIGSGIRIGTPAVTTRGMKEAEMRQIAELIDRGLTKIDDQGEHAAIRAQVKSLCAGFPLYDWLRTP